MEKIRKAGLVCCSNGLSSKTKDEWKTLTDLLESQGIHPVFSEYIFQKDGVRSGSARERAESLMSFYQDTEIDAIFDLSGGDIANEILPFLDFAGIAGARNSFGEPKQFWGYSDLTVILNAVYAKAGNPGVLYQIRHLAYADSENLFDFSYHFLQGNQMSGVVVGGNIRCLLKLAGTQYFPDMQDKILLLEARSGRMPQMITYFSQLQQLGVLEKLHGILLGTFTQLEQEQTEDELEQLVLQLAGKIPVAKTQEIGHAPDAKAITIGSWMNFTES
ncbi:MAG: LD-carboxypeptidase [Clostridia bacterium]|nr:LD-carboxypeptidase [Clostridia bacterium]